MNGMKALGIALCAVAASLASNKEVLAWPTCSHPSGSADSSPRSETAAQKAIREHLILRGDHSAGRWDRQEDLSGIDRRSADNADAPTRIREGLALPEQPRWRM